MASLNRFTGIGNLGRDPECIFSASGMAITKFSVAMTEKRKNKDSGEWEDFTEWARVTTFSKVAENCGKFLSKGSQVYFEGRMQTSQYEKDGITRYSTDIIANVVTFLSKSQSPGGQGQQQNQPQQPPNGGYGNQPPQQNQSQTSGYPQHGGGYGQQNQQQNQQPQQNQGVGYNNAQPPQQPYHNANVHPDDSDIPF